MVGVSLNWGNATALLSQEGSGIAAADPARGGSQRSICGTPSRPCHRGNLPLASGQGFRYSGLLLQIAKAGLPIVRLVPYKPSPKSKRKPGSMKGNTRIK